MRESSADLRRRILSERRKFPQEEATLRSQKIILNFLSHFSKDLFKISTLGLYRPGEPNIENEPNPLALLQAPELVNSHFAFPRILDRLDGVMDFAIPITTHDWVRGVYGLLEPRPELPAVRDDELSLIIIPGVVFGEHGERLGRGAGYYDRYLVKTPGALRVAFAYDFQVISDGIPQEPWDACMDWIVTDLRVIESRARL